MTTKKLKLSLGERLRFFRITREVSQFELELRTGLGNGSISRIENNEVNPSLETRLKIAEALELKVCDTAYLLDLNLYTSKGNSRTSKREPLNTLDNF